jgi:hypothetical protein
VEQEELEELVAGYLQILDIAIEDGPTYPIAIAMLEDLLESPDLCRVPHFQDKKALVTLRQDLESRHGAELGRFDDRVRRAIREKIEDLKRARDVSEEVRRDRAVPDQLPMGDELETRAARLDEIPREVLDCVLRMSGPRVDVVLLDLRDRRGREDTLDRWVAGWEEAVRRGGPSCRARAPRLAVVGIGLDEDLINSLEKKGILVVDRGRSGFSPDPEEAVRQRLHQILCGGVQSQLVLRSNLPNPFGPEGGPLESEADPSYETMPVPDLSAYDKLVDSLRRGRRSGSD